ncbi:MAG TPA: thioredoxin-like domain-containing protein [Patescibacteria group bacterium]|nr:thioredoxin-like domain-containing protein [Patescibacteria group bacterium]
MAQGDVYAPDFPRNSIWLNSQRPLTLADLRGQVVLLDFWTYCCVNCLHILPDLKYLEERYRQEPFLVIGVHSAKFFNEQNIKNIQSAIERYEIKHPVVVDNNHIIWESYGISAWPSFVLIDAAGRIRGALSGEGHRLKLDTVIGQLLEEGRSEGISAPGPLLVTEKIVCQETTLSFPGKITLDEVGKHLFVADSNHHRILLCHFHSPTQAHLLSVIGSGERGNKDGSFAEASFCQPQGLCLVDNFLYVCDSGNHLLRRVDLENQTVKTITPAGRLRSPWDLDYAEGYLYVAVAGSHQIWSYHLADSSLAVFAGSGIENLLDGNLFAAHLAQPSGLSVNEERIYFVDSEASALRMIDLRTDEVTTLIGRGLFDFGYRDGPFGQALLQHPQGIFAAQEKIYLADTYNQAIREANLVKREITTLVGREENARLCLADSQACEILPLFEPNDVKLKSPFLYLADTNNHLIRAFNLSKGELSTVELSTAPFLTRPR